MKTSNRFRILRATPLKTVVIAVAACTAAASASAAAEDWMAGAFDKVTGVPFASTMLGIVKAGEVSALSPAALDARLTAVEKLLTAIDARLKLLEGRIKQLQDEVVKMANINRLRQLQRIRYDLAEINAELKTHPSDPGQRSILMFRARQQADLLKNDVDFDIWKVSDVLSSTQTIRTRFFVYPAFELYAMAIATWFAAIEDNIGTQPQRVVAEQGTLLLDHAAFLTTRPGFQEWTDAPVALPEYLSTAAYCTYEAVNKYSDSAGNCTFATMCIDTMDSTKTETERRTWPMQPAAGGTMCTFNPNQAMGLKGEQELRDQYGAQLMAALARDLTRLATGGSLNEPFVGQFPNFIHTQLFAATLGSPLIAAATAAPGTRPTVPNCLPTVGGCSFGVQLSKDTAWTVANPSPGVTVIRHDGSNLCLDVGNSAPTAGAAVNLFTCNGSPSQVWSKRALNGARYVLASADGKMCATIDQAVVGRVMFQATSRGLQMQPCDGRALQQFSNSDGKTAAPH